VYLGTFYKLMALLQRSKTNDKAKKKKSENEDEHSDYFPVY